MWNFNGPARIFCIRLAAACLARFRGGRLEHISSEELTAFVTDYTVYLLAIVPFTVMALAFRPSQIGRYPRAKSPTTSGGGMQTFWRRRLPRSDTRRKALCATS